MWFPSDVNHGFASFSVNFLFYLTECSAFITFIEREVFMKRVISLTGTVINDCVKQVFEQNLFFVCHELAFEFLYEQVFFLFTFQYSSSLAQQTLSVKACPVPTSEVGLAFSDFLFQ